MLHCELTPYEAVPRSFGYLERLDREEHALVRSALERAVREAPAEADGWAMLSSSWTGCAKRASICRKQAVARRRGAERPAVAIAALPFDASPARGSGILQRRGRAALERQDGEADKRPDAAP